MKIEKLILGPLQTNCYILYDSQTKEAFLIDPGASFELIKKKIDTLSLKVKYIILTHAHCDHIGALDEAKQEFNAKVCIGTKDLDALSDSTLNLCSVFALPSPKSEADILLKDGDKLFLADKAIEVIETPGHTLGCISLLSGDFLISGDTLFFESVGRTDFPGGSFSMLNSSIKEKLFTLPQSTKVYPGHGESTTIEHEISNNPFVR